METFYHGWEDTFGKEIFSSQIILFVQHNLDQNPKNVLFRVQQADSRVHTEEQRAKN